MNLMDLAARQWSPAALEATAPDLGRRLPPIQESSSVFAEISPYWRVKYGFGPAKLIPWSGDNPSSLIGLGLTTPGTLGISLGTSDTVFGPVVQPPDNPDGSGHVFGSPAGGYMPLICFANGSLAREHVRDAHGLDWDGFAAALRTTPPGNGGAMMTPWFVPEITPPVLQPVRPPAQPASGRCGAHGARGRRGAGDGDAQPLALVRAAPRHDSRDRRSRGEPRHPAGDRGRLRRRGGPHRAAQRRVARRGAARVSRRPPGRGATGDLGGRRVGLHRTG